MSLSRNRSNTDNRARKVLARPCLTNRNWPRVLLSIINDSYCVNCLAKWTVCSARDSWREGMFARDRQEGDSKFLTCKPLCCNSSSFCKRVFAKERCKSRQSQQSKSCNSPQGRVHSPLPVLAKFDQVTHQRKLLCRSSQEPVPGGGIASAFEQKCCRTGNSSEIFIVLQPAFPGSQTQQPV